MASSPRPSSGPVNHHAETPLLPFQRTHTLATSTPERHDPNLHLLNPNFFADSRQKRREICQFPVRFRHAAPRPRGKRAYRTAGRERKSAALSPISLVFTGRQRASRYFSEPPHPQGSGSGWWRGGGSGKGRWGGADSSKKKKNPENPEITSRFIHKRHWCMRQKLILTMYELALAGRLLTSVACALLPSPGLPGSSALASPSPLPTVASSRIAFSSSEISVGPRIRSRSRRCTLSLAAGNDSLGRRDATVVVDSDCGHFGAPSARNFSGQSPRERLVARFRALRGSDATGRFPNFWGKKFFYRRVGADFYFFFWPEATRGGTRWAEILFQPDIIIMPQVVSWSARILGYFFRRISMVPTDVCVFAVLSRVAKW